MNIGVVLLILMYLLQALLFFLCMSAFNRMRRAMYINSQIIKKFVEVIDTFNKTFDEKGKRKNGNKKK